MMDITDLKIIDILKKNSRATASSIAKEIHLSVPAAAERMRRLEESGIIHQFTLRLNRERFDLNLLAFIFVTIEKTEQINDFKNAVLGSAAVLECHHIAGRDDYLLKVVVKDTKALEELINGTLKKIPGVLRTNTVIVLSTVKEEI
jgi:Lrp/AsnC family transcriptional regulator, leucine-responsive regulatory protein